MGFNLWVSVFLTNYLLCSEEIHDVQALLKSFRDNNYDTDLASIKENLTKFRKESREFTTSKKDMIEEEKNR